MEQKSQLTYEMTNNISNEDIMKMTNINNACLGITTDNAQQMQMSNGNNYNSYKDYLNRKFACQSPTLSSSNVYHSQNRNNRSFQMGNNGYGGGNTNMTLNSNLMSRNNYDQGNSYGNRVNTEISPYSSLTQFYKNNNALGGNPFIERNFDQRESRNGNKYNNDMEEDNNNDDLITSSKTNYGRHRKEDSKKNENNKDNNSLVNSACYKSIKPLDSIKHLPLEEQVSLLFNENQSLKGKIDELTQSYSLLQNEYNSLKTQKEAEQIDNKNKLNNLLIQNNKELHEKNKETEALLEDLVFLANDLSQAKGNQNEILTIDQIRRDPNQLKRMLSIIREEVLEEDKEINQLKKNINTKGINKKKQDRSNNPNDGDGNGSHSSNSYYPYNSKPDCLPCSLGINNSNKGYSPRMCSPNRSNNNTS